MNEYKSRLDVRMSKLYLINDLVSLADEIKMNTSKITDADRDKVFTLFKASMFNALGDQTKFSLSGSSVVFNKLTNNTFQLSSCPIEAKQQLKVSGIDYSTISQGTLGSYVEWVNTKTLIKSVSNARFLVTRPYSERGRVFNAIKLIDGYGELVAVREVGCITMKGVDNPNYEAINALIKTMKNSYPRFSIAFTQDNNKKT